MLWTKCQRTWNRWLFGWFEVAGLGFHLSYVDGSFSPPKSCGSIWFYHPHRLRSKRLRSYSTENDDSVLPRPLGRGTIWPYGNSSETGTSSWRPAGGDFSGIPLAKSPLLHVEPSFLLIESTLLMRNSCFFGDKMLALRISVSIIQSPEFVLWLINQHFTQLHWCNPCPTSRLTVLVSWRRFLHARPSPKSTLPVRNGVANSWYCKITTCGNFLLVFFHPLVWFPFKSLVV